MMAETVRTVKLVLITLKPVKMDNDGGECGADLKGIRNEAQ